MKAALDTNRYETEIKVSDEELAAVAIQRQNFMATGTTRSHPDSRRKNCKCYFCPSP